MNDASHLPPPDAEFTTVPPAYEPHAEPVDPQRLVAMQRVQNGHQSIVGAIIGGVFGAVIGAGAWAGITIATQFQIGFMAIGVGILVGLLVRKMGRGMTPVYGVIGAVFALLGCMAGNLLTVCWFLAENEHQSFTTVLSSLTPDAITTLLSATFNGMDLLFYGIAVYEGYKLSLRQFTEADLAGIRGQ